VRVAGRRPTYGVSGAGGRAWSQARDGVAGDALLLFCVTRS